MHEHRLVTINWIGLVGLDEMISTIRTTQHEYNERVVPNLIREHIVEIINARQNELSVTLHDHPFFYTLCFHIKNTQKEERKQ